MGSVLSILDSQLQMLGTCLVKWLFSREDILHVTSASSLFSENFYCIYEILLF